MILERRTSIFTVEVVEAVKKSTFKKHGRTLFAVLSASLGSASLGSIMGYITLALPSIIQTRAFHLNEVTTAVAVSFGALGALLGGPVGGHLSDTVGRKSTIIYSSAPFVFGWLMIVAAPNIYCFSAGRLLTGFSSGLLDSTLPVYIAEISAAEVRGFMGGIFELMTNLGIQYAYAIGTGLSWKWLAVACQVLPVAMLILMTLNPESPRWLLKMKRHEECVVNLQWLRGKNVNVNSEIDELKTNQVPHSGWSEFRKPYVYKPFRLVIALAAFQQLVGMSAIPQYMVEILTAAHDKWSPENEAAIVGALGVIANLFSAVFVDRFGRRKMLLVTTFILTLSLTGLAVYFTFLHFGNRAVVSQYSYVVFICIIIFSMSCDAGLGAVTFILMAELLPLNVRSKGTGLCISLLWFILFVVSFVLPYGISFIGYFAVFWIFVAISLLALSFIYFMIPETKGLTLEEIEKMYCE